MSFTPRLCRKPGPSNSTLDGSPLFAGPGFFSTNWNEYKKNKTLNEFMEREKMETKSKYEYVPIGIEYWKYEKEGESIEGVFIKADPNSGKFGTMLYIIKTNGNYTGVFGTTQLDHLMSFVRPNERIRITYNGFKKSKDDKDYKLFKVDKCRLKSE